MIVSRFFCCARSTRSVGGGVAELSAIVCVGALLRNIEPMADKQKYINILLSISHILATQLPVYAHLSCSAQTCCARSSPIYNGIIQFITELYSFVL